MKLLTRKISIFWLYPFIVFAVICLLPWWEHKGDELLPIASGYEYRFLDWQFVLLCHLAATIILSLVIIRLHLLIVRLVTTKHYVERNSIETHVK